MEYRIVGDVMQALLITLKHGEEVFDHRRFNF